tara:strand:- start:149 stop:478 length:330 start_codon:yes stop_codon:yes gene_type:complete
MAWVKIENNIVVQKQPYQEDGFVEVADTVICGMEQVGDSFVVPPQSFDSAMANLRAKRNALLLETDFYALSDVTMTTEMTAYRQALRDITQGLTTVEQVNAVVFPTKPN